MKNIEGLLRALEDQFWKGGSKFYENSLTDASLMVFAEPVGVLENLRRGLYTSCRPTYQLG
jgi:hypothetical protein